MKYRVLIVEDQQMPRRLMELYIKESESYTLVGSLTNADTAVLFCEINPVDVILMDVLTELGTNGLDAARRIKQSKPNIKIVVITSMPEASWLARARQIGVESFWYKESDSETVLSVLNRTMAGEHIYPDQTPVVPIGLTTNHEFTDREIEVLRELLTGDSNTEIAKRLNVTPETVKFHVSQMLQKTGFRTRTELATIARSLGIVIK